MRATGLEKGGIYRHFESKEELAGDAFDHAWKIAMDARFDGTVEIPNAVDRLKHSVRNFRDRRAGLALTFPYTSLFIKVVRSLECKIDERLRSLTRRIEANQSLNQIKVGRPSPSALFPPTILGLFGYRWRFNNFIETMVARDGLEPPTPAF